MEMNYDYKESPKKITFEKGCQMEYEDVWTLLVEKLLLQDSTEIILSKTSSGSDCIKFNEKVEVIFKSRKTEDE